ncbi:unnamed protein product [Rotaria sp. Silwood2]|nr:unnamed protein product [Rotaria sp. Silwood2]
MTISKPFPVINHEEQIVSHLFDILESLVNSSDFNVHVETTLDYSSSIDSDNDGEGSDESSDNLTDDSDYEEQQTTTRYGLENFALDYMQRALEYYDAIDPKTQKRIHTFKGLRSRFPCVTHQAYLSRFRTYLQNNGTKQQKIDCINDHVYEKFENARLQSLPVHDRDICHQSAFEFEMHSTRTLSYAGEKNTVSSVRSTNKITHRYTVQATINLAGQVVGPVFVCLQEKNGVMDECVRKNLFRADNIVTNCSASGKLTTLLIRFWIDNCLLPSIRHSRTLLLSDSWKGQGDKHGLYDKIKGLKHLEIPFKTTSKVQPLDVFFYRQWKVIPRRLHDRILLDGMDIDATERNNILKLQSLVHNQISSSIFTSMIKYAWFKAGYLDTHPGPFKTVTEHRIMN